MPGPQIIHFVIGDGRPPLTGPKTTIRHYGVVSEDGVIGGRRVVRGSIISADREVAADDALDWLNGSKRLLHKALDHRRSVHTCREDVCADVQNEIDRVSAVTVN